LGIIEIAKIKILKVLKKIK